MLSRFFFSPYAGPFVHSSTAVRTTKGKKKRRKQLRAAESAEAGGSPHLEASASTSLCTRDSSHSEFAHFKRNLYQARYLKEGRWSSVPKDTEKKYQRERV